MKRFSLVLTLFLLLVNSHAQQFDTLRVMQYNLLLYGANFSNCTSSTNNLEDKDGFLETITKHVKPDLLIVNEMGAAGIYGDRILANSLNTNGVNRYKRATIQSNSFSSLVNCLFFNKNKLALHEQTKVVQDVNGNDLTRAIDVCTFYYKDELLSEVQDTTFFHVLAVHLKAGSSTSDIQSRDLETEAAMDHIISKMKPGYFLIAGDMNMKNSNEQAFKNLTESAAGDHKFYDPIDELGSWNSNSSFAHVHTQSTRSSNTNNGCFSGGGMDDRFDVILVSGQVLEDTGKVSFVENSYVAVGQDGNHLNQSVSAGGNSSVPSSVLVALYEMSDHLPVQMDLSFELIEEPEDTIPQGLRDVEEAFNVKRMDGSMIITSSVDGHLTFHDLSGRVIQKYPIYVGSNRVQDHKMPLGIYIARFNFESGQITRKVSWFNAR